MSDDEIDLYFSIPAKTRIRFFNVLKNHEKSEFYNIACCKLRKKNNDLVWNMYTYECIPREYYDESDEFTKAYIPKILKNCSSDSESESS